MTQVAIEVHNLSRTFGARRALQAVSLSIAPGEMVALLGASGSRKSTLLRHLCGMQCADAVGQMSLDFYRQAQLAAMRNR